ncbi:MAG: sensory box histidine kinase/response regulator [Myxococcaceae bacterium]|nr:sensory box histidine kinase/response regulator [Myxococcaceae bacterium]
MFRKLLSTGPFSTRRRGTSPRYDESPEEEQRALAERHKADHLLRMAFRAARMLAWETNLESGALYTSDNTHEVLGLLPETPFDRLEQGLQLVHPDDVSEVEAALKQAAHEGATTDRRFRMIRQDNGQVMWLEWRSVTRTGPAGGFCVRGVLFDVTAAVQAEEALRISEARYRTHFEAAPEAIFTIDVDRVEMLETNQNAERLLGYTREELNRVGFDAIHPRLQPGGESSLALLARYLQRALGGELVIFEWTYLHATGQAIPCEVRLIRQPGAGRLVRLSVLDISERKRAEAAREQLEQTLKETERQLRQSQKMEAIGRLAGGVAHDFNNLLFVILGHGSMLLDELPHHDTRRAPLDQIVAASERAAKLTAQLLAFSRQQVLSARALDLNHTIEQLAEMLRRLIGEDIELTLKLGATRNVHADPSQMEQVVMNLAVNARDAMPSGGKLVIECSDVELDESYARSQLDVLPGSYVMLSVSDSGCGMNAMVRERIFEPFFTTKELGKGTGLGLSTVFGIVRQSGGNVSVSSEPGKGTTFKVYLPRGDDCADGPDQAPRLPQLLGGSEVVLLAEDDESVRQLARVILSKHGYHVLEASTPGDALLICEQFAGSIDLLLTDVVMPRMSGRELAERLSGMRPEMKLLFMSGYTDDAVVHHGVLTSGMAFVQKPLLPDRLLAKIRQVLDGPAASAPRSTQ